MEIARGFSGRISAIGIRFPVVIAVAKCEYEAWFLASLETIAGQLLGGRQALPVGVSYSDDVENRAGVKGWLTEQFPPGRIYKETLDQEPMTKLMNLERIRQRSRSFRRLCHALEEAVNAIDQRRAIVTPKFLTKQL